VLGRLVAAQFNIPGSFSFNPFTGNPISSFVWIRELVGKGNGLGTEYAKIKSMDFRAKML
jgi:hypothetical protein